MLSQKKKKKTQHLFWLYKYKWIVLKPIWKFPLLPMSQVVWQQWCILLLSAGKGRSSHWKIIYMKGLNVKAWWYPHPASPLGEKGTKSSLELGFSVLFYCYYYIYYYFKGKSSLKCLETTVFEPLCCWHFFLTAKWILGRCICLPGHQYKQSFCSSGLFPLGAGGSN